MYFFWRIVHRWKTLVAELKLKMCKICRLLDFQFQLLHQRVLKYFSNVAALFPSMDHSSKKKYIYRFLKDGLSTKLSSKTSRESSFLLIFSSYIASILNVFFIVSLVPVLPRGRGSIQDKSQEWGYVPVRPGASMFYWFYRTTHPDGYRKRPIILWVQVLHEN